MADEDGAASRKGLRRNRGGGRDREHRSSRRSKDDDGSGREKRSGSGREARQRTLTGREKGMKESRSWRSEGSALEGDWHMEPSTMAQPDQRADTMPTHGVATVDTDQLESQLDALIDGARRWIGVEPGSPAAGQGPRTSGRRLLPEHPQRFAAGRQYPRSIPSASIPLNASWALSCPPKVFDQIYSAWLWGFGEATPECQRTLEYREKWVEGKRSTGIVEKVIKFTANRKWTRDKCVEEVGKLLGQAEAAQGAYCSSRSLEAANTDWAGQEFQQSFAALFLWHEAHAEGNTLRWFLDAYKWARDKQDTRHDRTQVWEGPQDQPQDQPRGLKRTIDRVIAYANRRLLQADLETDTDPDVFNRMVLKGLPMHIVHEVIKTLLALVVGARVDTPAEARAILPISQEVLNLALRQRDLPAGSGTDAETLSQDPAFRTETLRCFVRCFELLSTSGQLKRREVIRGQLEKARPVESYRLAGRSRDLDKFQTWAMQTAEAIGEYQPSVAMVLSTGLLRVSQEVLTDDAEYLLPGMAEALAPPSKRFVALDDENHQMHSAKVFSTIRDWLLKGNLGMVKQCCQNVHLSCTLRVGDVEVYSDFIEALHKDDYYFMKVKKARVTDVRTSEFEVLRDTADPSWPGRVKTDLELRQHLFAGNMENEKHQEEPSKLFAVPGNLATPTTWPIIRRFAQTGFQFADDGHELVRAASDGSDASDVLMSDVHILLLDASRVTKELRKSLGLRWLDADEVMPSPPPLLFDIALAPHGVRVLAASHKQLIDTRTNLINMATDHRSLVLEVTAKAEAPFASTNRMLDTVYDAAIDGVECLFTVASSSSGSGGGSSSTIAAQRLWSLGFEYARDVCGLGLRAPEAARLHALVQKYETDYRSLTECASPQTPQLVRVLSGQSLRRSRSFENAQPVTPSSDRYLFAFTRQSKSTSDLVTCAKSDAAHCKVEASVVVDFTTWSNSGVVEFGELFIQEFEQKLSALKFREHEWDSNCRAGPCTGRRQQHATSLQVLRDKCQPIDASGTQWVVHFAVCSTISRRDAQDKLFCNGGIMDRLHERAGVRLGQVLELQDSYKDPCAHGSRTKDEDPGVSFVSRSDVFVRRCRREHKLEGDCLELYRESQSAHVAGPKKLKALERLYDRLRDYLLRELYAADLPSMRATGDAIEDGKKRRQLEDDLMRLPQSVPIVAAASWAERDSLMQRAEKDGIDVHAVFQELARIEGSSVEQGNEHVPAPLREKRDREAKMREDCAAVRHDRLLLGHDQASNKAASAGSILQELSGLTLQELCKQAKSFQINDSVVQQACLEENPVEAVIELIREKKTAVGRVIEQNERLIQEIMKRQLSEIRAEIVDGRANIRVLNIRRVPNLPFENCEIDFEVTASTPARRDELVAAFDPPRLNLPGRVPRQSEPSVPPQCRTNQLTLFVSSLCAQAPDLSAQRPSVAWRPASQDASEATARQCINLERKLTSLKVDFTKVDLAQTEEKARRRLRRLSRSALKHRLNELVNELTHVDSRRVRKLYSSLRKAPPKEMMEGIVKLVASLEQQTLETAKRALKNKLGFGYRLPQLYCGMCRLPLDSETNDEGATVSLGRDPEYNHLYYCGRRMSPDKFEELTDSTCGPVGGPQCKSCQRYQSAQVADNTGSAFAKLNPWAGHAKTDGAEIQWRDLKRVQPESLLGTGATGQVHKMIWTSAGGQLVAVKAFTSAGSSNEPSRLDQFKNEFMMLAGLRHGHVLPFYGHSFTPKKTPVLVMELCEGSVSEALRHDIALPLSTGDPSLRKRCGVHVLDIDFEQRRSWVAAQQRLAFARGIFYITHGRRVATGGGVLQDPHAQSLFQELEGHLRDTYTQHTVDQYGHRQSVLIVEKRGFLAHPRVRVVEAPGLLERIGAQVREPSDRVVTEAASRPRYSLHERLQWVDGVAKGLTYLHSQQIVHSDLKADNVLIAPGNVAKLCDFSFSHFRAFGQEEINVGTPGYKDDSRGEPGDVYSLGIFLWEVILSQRPLPRNHALFDPRQECTRLRWPPCALNVVEDESRGGYYARPPENLSYHPVESGARVDHWFGPGSIEPLREYNEILKCCVAQEQHRPTAEEVVAMLEKLRESDAHLEHLRLMALRTRTCESMASFRLAVEEPDTALTAARTSQRQGMQHATQHRHVEARSCALAPEVEAAAAASAQVEATRLARVDGLRASRNDSPPTIADQAENKGGHVATSRVGVAPAPAGLVRADAAHFFKWESREASTCTSDSLRHDEQRRLHNDDQTQHFDAAEEREEHFHEVRNTTKRGQMR